MKRFFTFILIIALILPAAVCSADREMLLAQYTLFIDGDFYNSFFNVDFGYDTLVVDIYFFSDFSGCYIHKQEWKDGWRKDYGIVKTTYKKDGDGFKLIYEDGSSTPGKWDENGDDMWLNLSGAWFRLVPVHSFDIQKDFKAD